MALSSGAHALSLSGSASNSGKLPPRETAFRRARGGMTSDDLVIGSCLNELVDRVFEVLLTAAGVRCGIALLQHVGFEIVKRCLAIWSDSRSQTVPS